uniref:Uncharacterized protein n=1 Tax=Alexandrium andersonii TaxID=327968 RepID=A0A7S2AVP5_9DINO|mmetsp:Transcript_18839/g.42820  ORF Transcript_18839/g.42820 Transcript_18839/m.42820 type:complete len:111 (+) Transcript_18839:74-406(+)
MLRLACLVVACFLPSACCLDDAAALMQQQAAVRGEDDAPPQLHRGYQYGVHSEAADFMHALREGDTQVDKVIQNISETILHVPKYIPIGGKYFKLRMPRACVWPFIWYCK